MKAQYPIQILCEVLRVSRSGYYAWRRRGPSARQREDRCLGEQIVEIHAASRQTYGSLRIREELLARGRPIGRRRVMRLMRSHHLQGRRRRGWRPCTTQTREGQTIAVNHLLGCSAATRPNQVWMTDMTYVRTTEGWLYVAGVLDAYSRRLVGWAFGENLTSELCVRALQMAVRHRRPLAGLVHHSDQGTQYASAQYQEALGEINAVQSMSRRGNCYDNAFIESFWSTLKNDCVERQRFRTRHEASLALFDYIESFYNRTRRHSSLGYLSPVAYELKD